MSETNPNAKQLEDVGHRLARHLSDALTALRAWRTPTGGMGSNIITESRGRCSMISAEAAIREWAALTYPEADSVQALPATMRPDMAERLDARGDEISTCAVRPQGLACSCGAHRELR